VSGAALQLAVASEEAFADNLAHLAALEREACLMLAVAFLRRTARQDPGEPHPRGGDAQRLPYLPAGADLERAQRLLDETATRNRRLEAAAEIDGTDLNFTAFCRRWNLGPFERTALMLLLMHYTAPQFVDLFRRCRFQPKPPGQFASDWGSGLQVGTLLSIICRDYREQVGCRRHFSVEGTLVSEDLVILDSVDRATNILTTRVCLHERAVRTILGDRNLYRTSTRSMRRERGSVSLAQVILPEGLKEEVVACVGNFLEDRAAGRLEALDAFFGYGTGLALLFHGPSGTGKTMLAKALSSRFDRQIITFSMESLGQYHSPEEVLAMVFGEAEMEGSIVLLDECDDVFQNNSRLGQALLTELEKARCVVILATNKPIDLDPAMERRMAMKVSFPLPDAALRLEMWRALLPQGVALDPDVDLSAFAERYRFSGGLIKNCILLAATSSSRGGGRGMRITRADLERAAGLQAAVPDDEGGLCRQYGPAATIEGLPLRTRDKEELMGAARAWQQLKRDGLGLNVLVSASDVGTGVRAAEALARECGLKVRMYDYIDVWAPVETDFVADPLTQRKISPLTHAFSENLGADAMTLFVDHTGVLGDMLTPEHGKKKDIYLAELEAKLREHAGLFCMVTTPFKAQPLPVEFHLHFALEHPPEEVQIRRWEERLGDSSLRDDELATLVERWPMHAGEIDFMARQAAVLAVIRGGSGRPGLAEVREVIGRYRRTAGTPVLFGER
jgi:hypothetical protein